jgi:hypothetical protein
MDYRWLIAMTLYTMLIGPILDVPLSSAKAKSRSNFARTTGVR